mgnify:CR=1 FL=1
MTFTHVFKRPNDIQKTNSRYLTMLVTVGTTALTEWVCSALKLAFEADKNKTIYRTATACNEIKRSTVEDRVCLIKRLCLI